MGCGVINLQKNRRNGHSALLRTRQFSYCSGESGGEREGKKDLS